MNQVKLRGIVRKVDKQLHEGQGDVGHQFRVELESEGLSGPVRLLVVVDHKQLQTDPRVGANVDVSGTLDFEGHEIAVHAVGSPGVAFVALGGSTAPGRAAVPPRVGAGPSASRPAAEPATAAPPHSQAAPAPRQAPASVQAVSPATGPSRGLLNGVVRDRSSSFAARRDPGDDEPHERPAKSIGGPIAGPSGGGVLGGIATPQRSQDAGAIDDRPAAPAHQYEPRQERSLANDGRAMPSAADDLIPIDF